MAIMGKKDKLAVRPTDEKKAEITQRRPYDLWTDMDQLFDQFRSNFDDLFWRPHSNILSTFEDIRAPMMDVADLGNQYEMKLEMPGIPKDNITIEVSPNTIEISATHETKDDEKHKNWLRRERSSMSFYRKVEFPEEVKADTVDAQLHDGVLHLTIPKVEAKPAYKSTKIKVK
ncbi:MAG: Hsp20/alpha crystallin family protein [Candidatus Thermoplasmatota archaeon]|nr:Hsp20/alpha crystallin family protein [Candidatus Thermoplasmatota archaeon]